jgi:Flp pilus assembly protein TadG
MTFRHLARSKKGASLVETAVALFFILPVVFYGLELCMFVYSSAVLQYATRSAVQYAMTHGSTSPQASCPTGTTPACYDTGGYKIRALVQTIGKSSGHNTQTATVTTTWPDSNTFDPGSTVTVSVSYPYTTFVHFNLPFIPQTIRGSATGKIVF